VVLLTLLRVALPTAATVAGGLAQIGEFSFVLQELAIGLHVLPASARGPILAAATLSIILAPVSLNVAERLATRIMGERRYRAWLARRAGARAIAALPPGLSGHAIIAGYGRVGRVVAQALAEHGIPHVAIDADHGLAMDLRARGVPVVWGDATQPEVFKAARPETASLIILAMPDAFGCRRVLDMARAANPSIVATARAHDDEEASLLDRLDGVGLVVMGEREIALGMAGFALRHFALEADAAQRTVDRLRQG